MAITSPLIIEQMYLLFLSEVLHFELVITGLLILPIQSGVVILICHHVPRILSLFLIANVTSTACHDPFLLVHSTFSFFLSFFQFCGNHGACIFPGGLAMCMVYDSGKPCLRMLFRISIYMLTYKLTR